MITDLDASPGLTYVKTYTVNGETYVKPGRGGMARARVDCPDSIRLYTFPTVAHAVLHERSMQVLIPSLDLGQRMPMPRRSIAGGSEMFRCSSVSAVFGLALILARSIADDEVPFSPDELIELDREMMDSLASSQRQAEVASSGAAMMPTTDLAILSADVAMLRKMSGVSQAAMADHLGYSRPSIMSLEAASAKRSTIGLLLGYLEHLGYGLAIVPMNTELP